jgi:transcriptional regulator GlxA family with amidase domain
VAAKLKIGIWVFNGVDELDVVGPYEALCQTAQFDVTLVTLASMSEIIGQHGLRFSPNGTLHASPDLFIVTGGGWVNHAPIGLRQELEQGHIQKTIQRLHKEKVVIASVCTGAMALGAAGLLKHIPATTHTGAFEDLRKYCDHPVHARVVDTGQVITAGGVTSGIDLALWIIERYLDKETADKTARYLAYDWTRDIYQEKK